MQTNNKKTIGHVQGRSLGNGVREKISLSLKIYYSERKGIRTGTKESLTLSSAHHRFSSSTIHTHEQTGGWGQGH